MAEKMCDKFQENNLILFLKKRVQHILYAKYYTVHIFDSTVKGVHNSEIKYYTVSK
jgi:hypothetical protein